MVGAAFVVGVGAELGVDVGVDVGPESLSAV
jgi:hypothetical protein